MNIQKKKILGEQNETVYNLIAFTSYMYMSVSFGGKKKNKKQEKAEIYI